MDKQIFNKVLFNKVIRNQIFGKVYWNHRFKLCCKEESIYDWERLLDTPKLLVQYNYGQLLADYLDGNDLNSENVRSQLILAIKKAIEIRNLDIFKFLFERVCIRLKLYKLGYYDLLFYTAKYGNLEVAKYLHEYDSNLWNYPYAFVTCPEGHNLELLKWLEEKERTHDKVKEQRGQMPKYLFSCTESAAYFGELEMVKWLLKNRTEDSVESVPRNAADRGHLEILQWLNQENKKIIEDYSEELIDGAAQFGHLEVIKWLHEYYPNSCTVHAMDNAASSNLEIVKWLNQNRTEGCTEMAMTRAAKADRLDIVRWLNEHRTEGCTPSGMDGVSSLEMVQWLHSNRTEGCTHNAIDNAARRGNLDIIQFLVNNRTEGSSPSGMDGAAAIGNFEILKYLHTHQSHGCSHRALENAIKIDHSLIVEWLLKHYIGRLDVDSALKTAQACSKSKSIEILSRFIKERDEKLLQKMNLEVQLQEQTV